MNSKINKFANIYDKDGNLLRKAPIKNYTIEELHEAIKNLPEDTPTRIGMNMNSVLFNLYQQRWLKNLHKRKNTKTEVIEKLKEVENNLPEEVEYEEVVENKAA